MTIRYAIDRVWKRQSSQREFPFLIVISTATQLNPTSLYSGSSQKKWIISRWFYTWTMTKTAEDRKSATTRNGKKNCVRACKWPSIAVYFISDDERCMVTHTTCRMLVYSATKLQIDSVDVCAPAATQHTFIRSSLSSRACNIKCQYAARYFNNDFQNKKVAARAAIK